MSRRTGGRRGRPVRERRVRVRTERRADIDYAALARAVLEQAARDEQVARLGLTPAASVASTADSSAAPDAADTGGTL